MIRNNPKRDPGAFAQNTDKALDETLAETFPASDAINLRQWNEMEASERARSAREERLAEKARADRLSLYHRGPTAFTA